MEFLIGIVGSVAAEIGKSLVDPVKRHIGYLIFYNRNITDLRDERKKLDDKIAEANQFVQDADKKFKVPIPGVPHWKEAADELNQKASKFFGKETPGASSRCLNGRCQNPWSRYSSSRKASKMTEDIRKKIQDAPEFGNVAYDAPQPNLGSRFNLEGLKDFESRLSVINDVWEALKNDELSMIGVCGMAGVGKTTLVKNLVKRAEETENLFGVVAMVVVSQNPNYLTIQDVIVERLGLKIEEKTLDVRAGKLHEWIMKCEKSILLILDDVWKKVDFEAIGLPLKRDKGYKIVLTSRNDGLCAEIGSQKNFRIDILNKEEARDLFKQTAGDSTDESLLPTAIEIADECGGLPIAIVTLAGGLKTKPKYKWDDALQQLKKCNMKGISEMKDVCSKLELSFDLLESEEAKSCFLLCCLFPEDYNVPVEDLISYALGLRLFGEVQNVHEVRNRVRAFIYELKQSFLLFEGDSDRYESVKMHDLLRDVAIKIASREKYAYLGSCASEMESWPAETDRYKNYTAISLLRGEIHEHPIDLECPKLQLLQLAFDYRSQPLSKIFFEGMKELKVLSLAVPEFSQPLDVLKKLRTLHLKIFIYGKISLIGALNSLEVLQIGDSSYEGLPGEIGLLRNLRVLNLREMRLLRYIPSGVLSRLSKLEELYVNKKFMKWECIKVGKINASLKELESHPITTLEIGVPNFLVMPNKSVISKLRKFKILIGTHFKNSVKGKDSANELYMQGDWNDVFASGISALLRNAEALGLSMSDYKNCLFELEDEGFPVDFLKVIPSSEEIRQLRNNDPVQLPSFHNLKHIEISDSDEIKYVFSLSMARGLKQLQSIKIRDCHEIEGIFYRKEVGNDDIEFPKLKYLALYNLPKLIGFCVDMDNAVVGHFSDQLADDEAMKPSLSCKDIPEQSSARIELTQLQHGSSHCIIGASLFSHWLQLQNLQQLNLSLSHSLEVVFPTSVAGQLIQLKKLHLEECNKLQYVVGGRQEEEKENKGTTKIVFPMLMFLYLKNLPKLVAFYPDGRTSFDLPSLKEISIQDCPKMKTFCPTFSSLSLMGNKSVHSSLPAENPTIRPIVPRMTRGGRKQKSADTIVQQHNSNQKPEKVSSLMKNNYPSSHIYDHTEACCVFPFKSTEGIWNLKKLQLENNDAFKVIFSFEESHASGVMLNVLQELNLDSLSKLTHIWFKIPSEITAFQNLKELDVKYCHSLKYIFSPRVVKLLVKLEKVDIGGCSMMESIVVEEEEEETCPGKIIFPRLRFMELESLDNLKSFCIDRFATVEFPLLEELELSKCEKMRTLCYRSVITSSREDQLNAIVEKKNKDESAHIYNHAETFSPFSIRSIEGMQNLKSLEMEYCRSCQVIFSFEDSCADRMLNNLEELTLKDLENLEHVWLKIPPEIKAFQNLKRIIVGGCDRLSYLFSPLLAKLLVKLEEVGISRCSMMEAVVAEEELEEEAKSDRIVFPQLRVLELDGLPNLRNFSIERSVTIELPLLEKWELTDCNSMRTFSYGPVITPKLKAILIDYTSYQLEKDLNTTLQKMWM